MGKVLIWSRRNLLNPEMPLFGLGIIAAALICILVGINYALAVVGSAVQNLICGESDDQGGQGQDYAANQDGGQYSGSAGDVEPLHLDVDNGNQTEREENRQHKRDQYGSEGVQRTGDAQGSKN